MAVEKENYVTVSPNIVKTESLMENPSQKQKAEAATRGVL